MLADNPSCGLFSLRVTRTNPVLRTDTNDLREIRLDEVVVTGTGTEHYLKDAPVQTEVITGKALEQYNGRSLDEILSALSPSITFSPGDMGSNIQLNGLKNDYILIMVNGKRMNGDIGGQNDLSIINPATIERIEIVKGASSSLYGSDAIAGVINIITKKNRDKVSVHQHDTRRQYDDLLQQRNNRFSNGKAELHHFRKHETYRRLAKHDSRMVSPRSARRKREQNSEPLHQLHAFPEFHL